MDRTAFEGLVAEALDSIPGRFQRVIENVSIVVEDEPTPALLAEMGIAPPGSLLGLYRGTPLTRRSWDYGNVLPDQISLFQGPIEREARISGDVVAVIAETLIHEIGHYFGMSEEQIQHVERHYWRSRP